MDSAIAAAVCAELEEAVFTLRQVIPPGWHGSAATACTAETERIVGRLSAASGQLRAAAELLRMHEKRAEAFALGYGQV